MLLHQAKMRDLTTEASGGLRIRAAYPSHERGHSRLPQFTLATAVVLFLTALGLRPGGACE
jgi:hypothetical protein